MLCYDYLKYNNCLRVELMLSKGKSIDGLMRHVRDNHGLSIGGSKEKKELLNMGYYHGYKAYKFNKRKADTLKYSTFSEIQAVHEFDNEVKALFYPLVMKIETAIKNYTIDEIVKNSQVSFEEIYDTKLVDYKSKKTGSGDYSKYLKKRLNLRTNIDNTIAYNYQQNTSCIVHFFHKGDPVPIWALFEVITLGEFGNFISCLSKQDRIKIAENLNIHDGRTNQNGRLLENIVFTIKGLRTAIAHNSIVFDCRFNDINVSKQIISYLHLNTDIKEISFDYIVDFLILLVLLLKELGTQKTELKRIIREFKKIAEKFRSSIPISEYNKIMSTNTKPKIEMLLSAI